MLGLLAALLLAGVDRSLVLPPTAEVVAETVTLADLADLDALPEALRTPAREVVLARLEPGASIELSRTSIAERARVRAPVLAAWVKPSAGVIRIQRLADAPAAPAAPPAHRCAKVNRSVGGGDFVMADDLQEVDCGDAALAGATWFDRAAGLVRAARPLPAGAVIAAPPASSLAQFGPGQAFTFSATVGPVRVERPVQAVRPAAAGDPVAVQDQEGRVLILPATSESGS